MGFTIVMPPSPTVPLSTAATGSALTLNQHLEDFAQTIWTPDLQTALPTLLPNTHTSFGVGVGCLCGSSMSTHERPQRLDGSCFVSPGITTEWVFLLREHLGTLGLSPKEALEESLIRLVQSASGLALHAAPGAPNTPHHWALPPAMHPAQPRSARR